MRLATFRPPGGGPPLAGEVRDERTVVSYDDDGTTTVAALLGADERPSAAGAEHALEDVELLAPVSAPRTILGIGLNYREHAREQGRDLPERPIVFAKLGSSSASPGARVRIPAVVERLDYEGELAVVIGAGGRAAGFAVADDLSARDLQRAEPQWTRAKGFDGACPWGPWVTTADEVEDPGALRLRTWVNGELRQDGSTSDLIFGVGELLDFIAETTTLAPGDVVLTGTPSGVGEAMDPSRFLAAGDVVRIEIEDLGSIEHAVA